MPEMIKTNEVRRGNLVAYVTKTNGKVPTAFQKGVIIDEIRENDFKIRDTVFGFDFQMFPNELTGIILTPEVLEKIGFYRREHLKDFFIILNTYNDVLIISDSGTTKICSVNAGASIIKAHAYLHELQNTVFDLTGKELDTNNF